ncbi:ribosome maturation factor RimM [Zwartia vadi]|uniref:ribosome maturation factor RimM n=1 Tax=Zwartia vadi TaxID=3058168 RepID=UPI0025B5B4A3|nr:ribosome maturation factor RimM [Zwartia vadi]MDN3988416.1 ribosome maturation factor RimM [Zwartia vadi]
MADIGAQQAPNDLIELGRIVSAYGVRGWVKVQPHSAQGLVLRAAPVWWLAPPALPASPGTGTQHAVAFRPHAVKQSRPQGSTVVADLEHVGDRDVAESLRGYTVHVSRQYFPKAQADEFYWVDLVGCFVFSDGQLAGIVEEVVDNGAHAILRVQRMTIDGDQSPTADHVPQLCLDAKGRLQEILVPFVAAHVQHVDIASRRIETDWPLDL